MTISRVSRWGCSRVAYQGQDLLHLEAERALLLLEALVLSLKTG
jgi:hypothetical protein